MPGVAVTRSFTSPPDDPEPDPDLRPQAAPSLDPLPSAHTLRANLRAHDDPLRLALETSDSPALRAWADAVGKHDEAYIEAAPPPLRAPGHAALDPRLRLALLTPTYTPPSTHSYVYPTNPPPAPGFTPLSTADIIGPDNVARIAAWEAKQWLYLKECAALGPNARRKHNDPLIIPASTFDPRARHHGRATIWDLRDHREGQPILPLDFDQPIHTNFDTAFLARSLAQYPDHELVTFLCRGVALKTESAPPDLVLCPHLVSLGSGIADAAKTISAHAARGAYGLYPHGPIFPRRALAQGSTPKKDRSNRRTTDGGGPRKKKRNSPSVKSLNAASKEASWVPETKPTLDGLSNDMAVLLHAGSILDLKLYQFTDDFKCFFNQLAVHPSQWHLNTFLWLSSLEEDAVPVHVIEYVLGFGLSPSSNVAQRFAEAILWLLRRRVDKDEAALRAADTDPAHQAFFAERAALGPGQDRLVTSRCYTDDSHFFALGVDRALSVLRHWSDITSSIRVQMASSDKRQAGATVSWLGILSNSLLGSFAVPHNKTLRAVNTLRALTDPSATVRFRDHRRLTGLLEHIVGVIHARRLVMYALYEPHQRLSSDPEAPVTLSALGHSQALAWIEALLSTPGRHCSHPDAPRSPAQAPHISDALARRFLIYTDAAKDGATTPSLGGWCHGLFFSLPIPPGLRGYPIPQLEFLGIICAAHVFAEHTRGCRTDLISDSDTCVKAILNDGAHAAQMQWLHLEYISSNSTLHTINSVRHAHGEINVPADLASRDRLPELLELSAQLHITPTQLPVPDSFLDILRRFEDTFGSQPTPPRSAKALSLEARRGKGFSSDDLGDGPSPPSGPPPTRPLSHPPPPLTPSPPALPNPSSGRHALHRPLCLRPAAFGPTSSPSSHLTRRPDHSGCPIT